MIYKVNNLKVGKFVHLRYNKLVLKPLVRKLERFIDRNEYFNSEDFAREMMFPQEIGFNSLIEGINVDIGDIIDTIYNYDINNEDKKRVLNMFRGYQYIMKKRNIDKESLRELYSILSDGLLDDYSIQNMGDYYREGEVYILRSSSIGDFDRGVNSSQVNSLMDDYLEYVNEDEELSQIEMFIKSQIMHLYFVYVHPYFDVNGRTSRTLSMWYLLNNDCYPYILFNRGIYFSRFDYKKILRLSLKTKDMTIFLEYMLNSVLRELKKEMIIRKMRNNINLSVVEEQILQYFLSMKVEPTMENLARFYNGYDPHKSISRVVDEIIYPMLSKGIFTTYKNDDGIDVLQLNKDIFREKQLVK